MKISIPKLSLVVLVGVSGSGKSTFAKKHFLPTEVLSSDFCRALVSDCENSLEATADAFDVLYFIARKRLAAGKFTVIDATNVRSEDRRRLVELAREYHCLPTAIVLKPPEDVCIERNKLRSDRDFGAKVIRNQHAQLRRGIKQLKREGFRHVRILDSVEEIESVEIERVPLWNDKREETGPFDLIGDIHGCFDELTVLLGQLGYTLQIDPDKPEGDIEVIPPEVDGAPRRLVFLGDLVDRGPKTPAVLRLAMRLVREGKAFCVPGNHDIKLMRKLQGRDVQIKHGLDKSLDQLEAEPDGFKQDVREFIDSLVSHYVFDGGNLVTSHAGLKEEMQGRGSGAVREFCMYGETTGETDEFGLPVRYNWAGEYRGKAVVVYGHTPVPQPEWLNNTINVDTGCVFGGRLTAVRYPERELVSVPALQMYAEPVRPIAGTTTAADGMTAQQQHDELLYYEDVSGKRIIETRIQPRIIIEEEQAIAALESISRFSVDPRLMIYLPPTMSPPEVSADPELLERPDEAFDYFSSRGVEQVVCEEKHMGSRVVIIAGKSPQVIARRFGLESGEAGICYTRTGRRFFTEPGLEAAFLTRITAALDNSGFWQAHDTDWVLLDCELMPWSHKAQTLLKQQYAAVGSAASASLGFMESALASAVADDPGSVEAAGLLERITGRRQAVEKYIAAYRRYCWPVESVDDLKLAPFHVLATEGHVHADKDHRWHLETIAPLCASDPELILATNHRFVTLGDETSRTDAINWWEELTASGGEGMVVKPLQFTARGKRGWMQPAIKCRGPEYLRIIYGPEYRLPANLARLKQRNLKRKRSMALREFALGIEALERFVNHQPLRRVHECVFGVLALECEPVDPRL